MQCACAISTSENGRIGEGDTLELLLSLGYAKQSITQAEHICILSEHGYAKLIKIMVLAWGGEIPGQYFSAAGQSDNAL